MQFNNINQVWAAIEAGKEVFWVNHAYHLTVEPVNAEWRKSQGFDIPFSAKGDKCLRVTCISNYFGSLLEETEIHKLFTE